MGSLLSRRNFMILGSTIVAAGAGAYATNGFGLLPEELAAEKVFAVDGIAIRGTDPVAYFSDGNPIAGEPSINLEWNGAIWQFASGDNRSAFEQNPAAYAPAYGGFCAWAVAEKGKLYSTQPANWAIVDDRLFLNYNDSVQQRWDAARAMYIRQGDERWPEILRTV